MSNKAELIVEDRKIQVSNLDKVLYPKVGFTKGQVIDYYIRIAPVLLPHLKDRPLTMKRYPDGVDGEYFYAKHAPEHRPGWVPTARVPSPGSRSPTTRVPAPSTRSPLRSPSNIGLSLTRWRSPLRSPILARAPRHTPADCIPASARFTAKDSC